MQQVERMTIHEARFRRRPRDNAEGWEVFLDGQWCDCRDMGTPDGKIDDKLRQIKEDPSRREAVEESYPKGLLFSLR